MSTVAAIAAWVTVTAAPAAAIPPDIPSYATAVSRLAELTVAAESHHDSYDRYLFPHRSTVSGSCNTREEVLRRVDDMVPLSEAWSWGAWE